MTIKHTPGPWRVDVVRREGSTTVLRDVQYVDGLTTTYRLADVIYPASSRNTVGEQERHANASLIAAAPDLLDALRGVLAVLPVCPRNTGLGVVEAQYNAAVVAARAVIRKALGDV